MNKSGSLGVGAITGIAAGSVCLLVICIGTICYMVRSGKQDENRVIELNNTMGGPNAEAPNFDMVNNFDIYGE